MKNRNRLIALLLTGASILLPLKLSSFDDPAHPPVVTPTGGSSLPLSQLLPPILTPVSNILTGLLSLLGKARDMKLLVLSADGTDPSFAAIRAILDQIGVPYDAVVLTQ